MWSMFAFSSAAMLAALIMPRSATTQTLLMAKCLRKRSTTGVSRVTSAVLPGHRKERKRPVGAIQHDAEHHLFEMGPIVLVLALLTQLLSSRALEIERGRIKERD